MVFVQHFLTLNGKMNLIMLMYYNTGTVLSVSELRIIMGFLFFSKLFICLFKQEIGQGYTIRQLT